MRLGKLNLSPRGDKIQWGDKMNFRKLLEELCAFDYEQEWFEFKENWFEADELGKYISALANAAAFENRDYAYFIWGVSDCGHKIVGTNFNPDMDYRKEPLRYFLSRQLYPENDFSFFVEQYDGMRVVVLQIPVAKKVPLSWKGQRYIRIGSSKELLSKFPEKEATLFRILNSYGSTIENTPSEYQNLSFSQLLIYYVAKGIPLREESFKENLGLLTKDGQYNIMAQLLSDDSHISIRVAIFLGKTKADPMYTVREFGHKCLLLSVDDILRYADILNVPQADESDRVVDRKEVPLFDAGAFREAAINAFVHNDWTNLLEPMFTIYSDRIVIFSRGELAKGQSIQGFFQGRSVPVNKKLSDIFLQLHISERTGRGVPRIIDSYGKQAFEFLDDGIEVTIPFHRINIASRGDKWGDKWGDKKMPDNYAKVLNLIRDNPNVTKPQIAKELHIGKSTVDRAIEFLKGKGLIERIGSNKSGYWKVLD